MAELLGIVASGIAVGQATAAITSSLMKLKSLWNELRDVPDDLLHLVRELEIVYAILQENEGTSPIFTPPSRSLELSMQLMNDAAKDLKVLVDELQIGLRENHRWKEKIGVAKVVLKRDQVKKMKSRLKTCIRLLNMAKQCQFSAMLEKQPEMIAVQLTTLSRTVENIEEKDTINDKNALENFKRKSSPQRYSNAQGDYAFRWKLRLLQRQWHINCYRSRAGWDLVLRVFCAVPWDSLVLNCIREDDAKLLGELFREGKASPLSTILNPHFYTLLSFAVFEGSLQVCRLLLAEGAKVFEETIETESAMFQLNANSVLSVSEYGQKPAFDVEQRLQSLAELILQGTSLGSNQEALLPFSSWEPAIFRGTLAVFKLLQTSCYPDYYEGFFQSRADIANHIGHSQCNSPDLIRCSLGDIDRSQVNSPSGTALLSRVAERFGSSLFEANYIPSHNEIYAPLYSSANVEQSLLSSNMFREENYPFCGWQAFVGQLVRAGADPNLSTHEGTHLMRVLVGAFYPQNSYSLFSFGSNASLYELFKRPKNGEHALHAWLEILQGCGIDLEEYGRKEAMAMSKEDEIGKEIYLEELNGMGEPLVRLPLRIIAIKYGPTPEDWKLWFSDPTDQLAGEFWDMVEHPERRMPGAWDEFNW